MANIQIKIVGDDFRFFDNFTYQTQINTTKSLIAFDSFINLDAFAFIVVEIYKDKELIFTGEIVDKDVPNSIPPKPFTYKAQSLTHRLESNLPLDAFPLELEDSTLKDVVEYICGFFDIVVLFDQSTESEANTIYKRSDLAVDKTALQIINERVTNAGLILTHSSAGELIITKSIAQEELILPLYLSNGKSYNLKGFFYNYIALGEAPINDDSPIEAVATYSNIDNRRNKIKIQNSGDVGSIESKALGMRADSLKSIAQSLSFNKFFCNIGDYVMIGDSKLIINSLNYSNNSKDEKATITLIDSQIYER